MNRTLAPALAALALACNRPAAPATALPDGASGTVPAVAAAAPTAPPPAAIAPGTSPDAGAPSAELTAPPAPPAPPSAPPAPVTVPITVALARVGALELPLEREGVTLLDPGAAFDLEVPLHLADGRLSLRDESDAMVASTGTAELGDSTSHYRLVPDEPLRPGSRYTLHLDGAVTRELHGPDGRTFAPLVLQLKTSGERPAPPPRKKRGSRR